MPVEYFDKKENTPGAISTKLATDAYQINNMITGVFGVICLNVSTVSISLFFAFYYSWKLTLIVLALSPLMAISGSMNMKVMKGLTGKTEDKQKFIGSLVSDTVCNIRTVKSFGNPKNFLSKFEQKLTELSSLSKEKAIKSSFFQSMGRAMIIIVEGITFFIASVLFQKNYVGSSQEVFIAIFSIIFAAMGIGQNSAYMPDMAKAKVSGAHIFDIIESKGQDEISREEGGVDEQAISGEIQFKNVTFKYPERDAIVLEHFNLKVNNKSKVALVGPSGSGKSTIIQLLMRYYSPT